MSNTDPIRWQQRYENFQKAFKQLDKACNQEEYTELERAGLVQMFEFTIELACNTLKDRLFYDGYEVKTPREAIHKAFEVEYISEDDTELLLEALTQRNIMSHTYEESKAILAQELITGKYHPLFDRLNKSLSKLQP